MSRSGQSCLLRSCARQHDEACYIQVLISEGTKAVRTAALENCESRDIHTLASILTGFKETSYLSIIIPEIRGVRSCWDLEVPPRIDFKECDISSVKQFLCDAIWMQRHEGHFLATMNAIWHLLIGKQKMLLVCARVIHALLSL